MAFLLLRLLDFFVLMAFLVFFSFTCLPPLGGKLLLDLWAVRSPSIRLTMSTFSLRACVVFTSVSGGVSLRGWSAYFFLFLPTGPGFSSGVLTFASA